MTKWLIACAGVLLLGAAQAADAPKFQVDPAWPKPLPNNWIMGAAAGVAVDAQDHIWVVQRPKTLTDDEKAASSLSAANQMLRGGAAGDGVRPGGKSRQGVGRQGRRL